MNRNLKVALVGAVAIAAMVLMTMPADAGHAWANYHWERSINPVTINLGDNVDAAKWGARLAEAGADWDASSVLNTPVVAGNTRPKSCRATSGMVEVCSADYGGTGWLGVAQISVSGDHIVQGTAKVNDYYHDSAPYNTYSWKQLVMCQEIGHTFGLGHQNEDFNTDLTTSCMEYTSDPAGNESPDQHDYQMLEDIYAHLDSDGGGGGDCKGPAWKCAGMQAAPPAAFNMPLNDISTWGKMISISRDGGHAVFEQDFGNGYRVYTHVTWTLEIADFFRNRRGPEAR